MLGARSEKDMQRYVRMRITLCAFVCVLTQVSKWDLGLDRKTETGPASSRNEREREKETEKEKQNNWAGEKTSEAVKEREECLLSVGLQNVENASTRGSYYQRIETREKNPSLAFSYFI